MRSAKGLILILLVFGAVAVWAGENECKAKPDECEKQIRAFLAEKKYLGVTLRMTRWGVVVTSVAPDSPAQRGGLREGDRLIGIGGFDCTNADMTEIKKRLLPPGKDVDLVLTVNRLGDLLRLRVKLVMMPKDQIDKIVQAHLDRSHQNGGDEAN